MSIYFLSTKDFYEYFIDFTKQYIVTDFRNLVWFQR